jgi:hypothetical protein
VGYSAREGADQAAVPDVRGRPGWGRRVQSN